MVQILQDNFPDGQTSGEALVIEVLARSSPGARVEMGEDVYGQQTQASSPGSSRNGQQRLAYSPGSFMYGRPTPPSRHDSAWSVQSMRQPGSAAVSPSGPARPERAPNSPGPARPLDTSREESTSALQRRPSTRVDPEPTIQKQHMSSSSGPQRTAAPIPVANASTMPPINVLLVDDNSVSLNVLAKRMRGLKLRYETATNGQIAVEKWQAGRFHIIFMDLRMPIMDGVSATREIRRLEQEAHPPRPPVIIVALTASSLPADRDDALAAGCNDFLTKPPDLPWLDRKVQEWGCMQALIDFQGWRQSKGYEAAA